MRTQNSIKLISLNIEMNRHFERFVPFLKREQPDVVCLQEVSEFDFPKLKEVLQMEGRFEPMMRIVKARPERTLNTGTLGLAFFTRFPAQWFAKYYSGDRSEIPPEQDDNQGVRGALFGATLDVGGMPFTIATTHFTWTPDGEASAEQRADVEALLDVLKEFPDIAFCGDFNAPRGREIWERIASRYTDTIPREYTSSIDPVLHRAKGLAYVVDGLFTSPHYRARDVRLVEGVSDHKAIVAHIERA